MKTIMSKSFQDLSSKRQFHWTAKVSNEEQEQQEVTSENPSRKHSSNRNEERKIENIKVHSFKNPEVSNTKTSSTLNTIHENKADDNNQLKQESASATRRKLQTVAVARLKSVLTAFGRNRSNFQQGLGTRVVGTLFGHRRGHVHFAFQKDSTSQPAFLVELATPISGLVREMASGLVRIALECDKEEEKKVSRLIDEPVWRTYCNGKKCGFATKREIGEKELQILKSVEPISMGAGVLPGNGEEESAESGEIMYMRAKFERVIGSRDSEAFYMMNPDSNGAPELSIYLLRV
ncbi:Protein MIZU-KUSSEI 1 [Capsicum chinense]|uniref:Protein MIZU-KUSSEI 1 n=1 Tax=Capsicum annuum TaxID=4072 RepID=A0A1U8GFV0_CAPAN|nr:protein MIZU-KUSSEI 1 [Capsicum annuum]KAF3645478.1 Protein MIZU-KUSSEI 1 [Capsicum annuum]KAF3650587.1 Protein MIZU-KUSSEI 1 [Capsicum annuum]PHT88187.1 Protein MIZU-KUSSEI 1 [Capsicum annuum]PHU23886.1 Protein MIZU-KUSSEI 1 [Capsicum chinense]